MKSEEEGEGVVWTDTKQAVTRVVTHTPTPGSRDRRHCHLSFLLARSLIHSDQISRLRCVVFFKLSVTCEHLLVHLRDDDDDSVVVGL